MSDSEVADLCYKIYFKHKQAIDLIIEHRPDIQSHIAENIYELLNKYIDSHTIFVASSKKRFIDFGFRVWQETNLPLLFHFDNSAECLVIRLLIKPVEKNNSKLNSQRTSIYQLYLDNLTIFQTSSRRRKLSDSWTTIYQRIILNKNDYESNNLEYLIKRVENFWEDFIKDDLINIRDVINKIEIS